MTVTPFDKILAVIEKHDGIATKTDIKCSIAKFNQAGGADELEKILADMVAQGILFEHLHEAGNNKTVKFYRSRNGYAIRANPIQGDDINMYATINLTDKGRDFARELVELLANELKSFKTARKHTSGSPENLFVLMNLSGFRRRQMTYVNQIYSMFSVSIDNLRVW